MKYVMNRPLIERLAVEDAKTLLRYTVKYPNTGELITDKLTNTEYWLDLDYDSILTLDSIFKCGYSPTGIANLFKNKSK
jgi:hypothetical protein